MKIHQSYTIFRYNIYLLSLSSAKLDRTQTTKSSPFSPYLFYYSNFRYLQTSQRYFEVSTDCCQRRPLRSRTFKIKHRPLCKGTMRNHIIMLWRLYVYKWDAFTMKLEKGKKSRRVCVLSFANLSAHCCFLIGWISIFNMWKISSII